MAIVLQEGSEGQLESGFKPVHDGLSDFLPSLTLVQGWLLHRSGNAEIHGRVRPACATSVAKRCLQRGMPGGLLKMSTSMAKNVSSDSVCQFQGAYLSLLWKSDLVVPD